MDRKELAKQSAMARSRQQPARGPTGAQNVARGQPKGNNLTFFSEDSSGLKLSPKTVLVLCLLYMGIVVLLHIFGKVRGVGDDKKEL